LGIERNRFMEHKLELTHLASLNYIRLRMSEMSINDDFPQVLDQYNGMRNKLVYDLHSKKLNLCVSKFECMKTIHFQVPDDVDLKDYEYSVKIPPKLYEDCKLSYGQAAQIAGLFKGLAAVRPPPQNHRR